MRTDFFRPARPWWFPGPLLRAYGLVALGLVGYLVRLSLDPWSHIWRVPGRSLLILLVQPLPLALGFLVVWSLAGRWLTHATLRRAARWAIAAALATFCTLDGAYSAIAERHLFEPGQLTFLFRDGAFWASGVLSIRLVVAVAALLAFLAYWLVASLPDVPRSAPFLATLGSLGLVFAINVGVLASSPKQPDLYAFAISANPIYGLSTAAREISLGQHWGVKTAVPGLILQREMLQPPLGPPPPGLLVQPRLFLVILLDGFRADFLTPELAPHLYSLAKQNGVVVDNYYTSYPGTDRSVYSLLYSRHPFFADQAFLLGASPVSRWVRLLRRSGYSVEAFQSNPHIYRFLFPVYRSFDHVEYGTADQDPLISDQAMLTSVEARAASQRPDQRLFAFVLLHSTHYPFNGKRIGSPAANYRDAVRYLDQRVGELLQGLLDRGVSFLALVGGDHGTSLGECGRVGYSTVGVETLHAAMAAIGSADTAPAMARVSSMKGAMLRVPSLLPLVLDPNFDAAALNRPAAQWNVVMSPGSFVSTTPLTAHNLGGDAMRVELGRDSAVWRCGKLDGCGSFTEDACREDLMAQAGSALLEMQRPIASPRRD